MPWAHQGNESDPLFPKTTTSDGIFRVLSLLDSLSEILLLAATAHYLLYPPITPPLADDLRHYDRRECALITFAIAAATRRWTIKTLGPMLLVFALLSPFPEPPLPENPAFLVMQFAFVMQLFAVHHPFPHSPWLIIPVEVSLPLMEFIKSGICLIFTPVVLFYVPVLLFAVVLLSMSMADTAPNLSNISGFSTSSPIESRGTFLVISGIVVLFLLLSLVTGTAALPSLCHAELPRTGHKRRWDRYGLQVGLRARKLHARTLVNYSTPYYFPQPFNVLQIVFVSGPSALGALMGYQPPGLRLVERIIWRVTVGPVAALAASFWLWNFLVSTF